MSEIMTDTSSEGMTAAIAEALEACFRLLATAPGCEARTQDGMSLAVTGLPVSDFNGVFHTQLDPGLPDAEIDRRIGEAARYLRSRGVPFSWWVMPDDRPPDLRERLVAHGFAPEGERPGMAIDLDRPGSALQPAQGVAIEEVTDTGGLSEHMRLMALGFGMPSALEAAFEAHFQKLPFGPGTSMRYFLARERGHPVGTSLVILSGGAAGIFNVITVTDARGRGVGTLVTDAALRAAREAGYRIAILESSRMGYNVYRRLGFEAYCTIGHYAWKGEAEG